MFRRSRRTNEPSGNVFCNVWCHVILLMLFLILLYIFSIERLICYVVWQCQFWVKRGSRYVETNIYTVLATNVVGSNLPSLEISERLCFSLDVCLRKYKNFLDILRDFYLFIYIFFISQTYQTKSQLDLNVSNFDPRFFNFSFIHPCLH